MANILTDVDDSMSKTGKTFVGGLDSNMHFKSNFTGDSINFDWIDQIESVCPYIDNIYRRAKLTLAQEETILKAEKSKKITVASIKDLSKHTNYVTKVDKKKNEIEPSKILNVRSEETYNIYENRFLYTLLNDLDRFILKKEKLINEFQLSDNKILEYSGKTKTDVDNVNIEVKICSSSLPSYKKDKKLEIEIKSAKLRIKKIKEYLSSWRKSDMIKALEKEHVALINPPIKKTNIILKNPNFQLAVKLWELLISYNNSDDDNSQKGLDNDGNENIKDLLDHAFLVNYCALSSISPSKRKQKENLSEYAMLLLSQEIRRIVSILLNSGVKITDEEILAMIANEIKNERSKKLAGVDDVKHKFENAIDEYLERMQNFL